MIVFDIETGPLPEDQVLGLSRPFEPPAKPEPFDVSEVKLGNLKDAEKISAKIADAKAKRDKEIADYGTEVERLRETWRQEAIGKAALDATTGQVLAIGYRSCNGTAIRCIDDDHTEENLLVEFWMRYKKSRQENRKLVGHNIFNFDLPFLVQRSWIHGLAVPPTAIEQDRYWDKRVFADTMTRWALGRWGSSGMITLDRVAKTFGLPGKPEGIDGGDFARLFFGTELERKEAIAYLDCDLDLTYRVAVKIGIV